MISIEALKGRIAMFRLLVLISTASVLAGCATLSYPLPKCDGYAKRPLNRSMWEWEDGKRSASQRRSSLDNEDGAAPVIAETARAPHVPAAFASFDAAGSYRVCQAV